MWRAMNSSTAAAKLNCVACRYASAASRSTLQMEQKLVLQGTGVAAASQQLLGHIRMCNESA